MEHVWDLRQALVNAVTEQAGGALTDLSFTPQDVNLSTTVNGFCCEAQITGELFYRGADEGFYAAHFWCEYEFYPEEIASTTFQTQISVSPCVDPEEREPTIYECFIDTTKTGADLVGTFSTSVLAALQGCPQ